MNNGRGAVQRRFSQKNRTYRSSEGGTSWGALPREGTIDDGAFRTYHPPGGPATSFAYSVNVRHFNTYRSSEGGRSWGACAQGRTIYDRAFHSYHPLGGRAMAAWWEHPVNVGPVHAYGSSGGPTTAASWEHPICVGPFNTYCSPEGGTRGAFYHGRPIYDRAFHAYHPSVTAPTEMVAHSSFPSSHGVCHEVGCFYWMLWVR